MTKDSKNDRGGDDHHGECETAAITTITGDPNRPARPSPATKTSQSSEGSTNHHPPSDAVPAAPAPLPRYHDSTWTLMSQGAEARVWLVPSFASACRVGSVSTSESASVSTASSSLTAAVVTTTTTTTTMAAVCKERFPKRYRHPTLDAQITKSRIKAECRCLVRCRKAGVPCPAVLGVDMGGTATPRQSDACSSKCIFLEVIRGTTVREFFQQTAGPAANANHRDRVCATDGTAATAEATASFSSTTNGKATSTPSPADDGRGGVGDDEDEDEDEVRRKRNRVGEATTAGEPPPTPSAVAPADAAATTRTDEHAVLVAGAMGTLVARMHDADVVHGDLTTSNMMLCNAPPPPTTAQNNEGGNDGGGQSSSAAATATAASWTPELTLIDFGLASVAGGGGRGGGSKKKGAVSSVSSVEEKAVDLYVLERAFLSTHPGSEDLVAEMIRTYKKSSKSSDAVLQRLFNVRQRGRKRECFG